MHCLKVISIYGERVLNIGLETEHLDSMDIRINTSWWLSVLCAKQSSIDLLLSLLLFLSIYDVCMITISLGHGLSSLSTMSYLL